MSIRTRRWLALALALAVVGGGVAIAATRASSPASIMRPRHALAADGSEVIGKPSAPVLVEEYADFQCPACGRFEKAVYATIVRLVRQGQIRYAYYPVAFLGAESLAAANAAELAGDEGRFWAFHDALLAHQFPENSGELSDTYLIALARQLGITAPAFADGVRNGIYDGWIRRLSAQWLLRWGKTPLVLINGKPLTVYTAPALLAAVRAARSRA
ncbi:MAG: DsbA family protein [Thermoleophilia bacterium]